MIDRETLNKYVLGISKTAGELIFYCDNEGRIREVVDGTKKTIGYETDEVVGKSFLDFVEPSNKLRAKNIVKKVLEGKVAFDCELTLLDEEDREVMLSCSAFPLKSSQGSQGFLVVGRDIGRKAEITKSFLFQEEGIASTRRSQLGKKLFEINEKLEEKTSELTALFQIGQQVVSSLNLEETLDMIAGTVTEMVGAKQCLIFLLDEEKDELVGKVGRGFSKKEIDSMKIRVGESITGAVAKEGKPLLLSGAVKEQQPTTIRYGGFEAKSLILAPLVARKKVIGVISVMSRAKGKFDKGDLEIINLFANQAAIAVENARLFALTEHLAITDGITDLYNHRYFQQRLDEEVKRSRRYRSPLALVMFDIDYFKKYNDTYGHPQGDLVLEQMAHITKSTVRETDIVARYGGEEFIIILPATKKEQAIASAERLRQAVASYPFAGHADGSSVKLTISLGVSSFPGDAKSTTGLISKADQALYVSKQKGRNRVSVYQKP